MARQGASRPKVVSSGRLTASGRGHIYKKKVVGRSRTPLEPAYSLYSTDSEDQVTTVHKGLDRCAALLSGILAAEQEESNAKAEGKKSSISKSKPKILSRKTETDRKQHGRKTNAGTLANKKPVPVQKTILSARSYPGLNPVIRGHPAGPAPGTKPKPIQQHSVPPGLSQPAANSEVQKHTVFNCRLTTSTPALSPQRPASAHDEPCSSKCAQSRSSSTEGFHHADPPQFARSFPIPPAVQQQCLVAVQSPFQNGLCTPAQQELPLIARPVCDGPVGSSGNLSCPSTSVPAARVPVQTHVSPARPDPDGPLLMMRCSQERSEESEGDTSAEDENKEEHDVMDTTPVRDISTSPEKTARRVMTVRYMLGELKTLLANQDGEAVRLISEVEQSISLLPLMVGSTNIQAEIALAVQPLRSENAQLRRRLRILNQQLLERERAERRARPVEWNMEVVALQSLNVTLQTQLNESHGEIQKLQQENMRLQNALEKKENDWQRHKEQLETENSRLRLELSEALAEMKNCLIKLQEHEIEKTASTLRLQQGEAEINTLQEFIRSLQRNQIKPYVTQSSQQLDPPQPNSHLTKSVLALHENAQRETTASDKLSNTVKTYLQTLEGTGQASPPRRACAIGKERITPSDSKLSSLMVKDIHKPTLEAIAENVSPAAEQKSTSFAPLKETSVGQHVTGVAPSKPLTQCDELTVTKRKDVDENVGLKYMARAFEKLGVSDGFRNQIFDQFQRVRQCQEMDAEGNTGRPSVMESTFSSCDNKSLASDWSVNTWPTFNTQDEQNFRDGLAALDASIESLQRTLRADLNK
ncbi:coiled-coil domain-containing protein 14 isoform X2 [Triplophysa rosa]|uniref:Coiled-coil domain-containing protein 14 n=1 Tax=Triplophysa rosa TaxID=992332 RepID=A0A9W8C5K1_TRIRA|nr:coiled-coil domain-containing protein 14 isoform X2 [Triplophysa rosa]KAI7807970.1 putative coiled-coil domain-containing protein 14 [Triplophysa rosa]